MINNFPNACIICNACNILQHIQVIYDDRFGFPGKFALLRCSNCGHIFLDAKFSNHQITTLYTEFYPRSSFQVEDHCPFQEESGFIAWLNGAKHSAFRWVPRNVSIIDIGCGFGETLGYHQARGCEVYGVEADENILRVAERYGYKVHAGVFDPDNYLPEFFDYVTMDQVIEHVQNPVGTFRGIAKILKLGGVVILSTPNTLSWGQKLFGQYWIHWHAPYHLQFFTSKSMKIAAEQAGLIVEKKVTITPSVWLFYQLIHLFTRPEIGSPSIFWNNGINRNFYQRLAYNAFSVFDRYKINHAITRIFDLLGVGDNQLFFLRKPVI